MSEKKTQHGHAGSKTRDYSPTYQSWQNMKQRCLNPNHSNYHKYGGKGISVCDRWLEFRNFLADMGERPSKDYCLSRIDHGEGYFPGNVIWETKDANNKEAAPRGSPYYRPQMA